MPDVIGAAWRDFNKTSHFDSKHDAIALITGPISKTDSENVCRLLEFARGASDAFKFDQIISQSNTVSDSQRAKLAVIRHHITNANGGTSPDNDKLWKFLKCFHLIGFDMDLVSGVAISLIQSLIGANSPDDVGVVWGKILQEVQQKNSVSGIFTRESVSQPLQDCFKKEVIKPVVTIAPRPVKETLALNLIGAWDENAEGDRSIVETLSRLAFTDWQAKVREIWRETKQINFLQQGNGHWSVCDRLTLWESEGPLLTDDLIDKFAELAVKVLKESDPELELEKCQRFASTIYDRKRHYSKRMRKGVAETLALLGANPQALATCRYGKAQSVTYNVVKQLLGDADSGRWASLNDVLPLLAESSPDAFLASVGGASEKPTEPFSGVFAKEDGGLMGRNYATGLLSALETLAWSPNHLVRVCSILANLSAIDPGGRYANRPANSLVTILLPWIPGTCADKTTRHNAVQCVIRDRPEVAWKLILQLLPKHHSTSFPMHKPKFQPFIREDWKDGVTKVQRWEDEGFYADRAMELAGNDPEKLAELLPFYFYIHPRFSSFMEDYRNRLLSPGVLNLPEEQRLALWIEIANKTSNHRKYADSDAWNVPEEMLQQLDDVADRLKPQKPEVRHRRLFSGRDFDLYDEKGNLEDQNQRLLEKRIEALREIMQRGGTVALKSFWQAVESPQEVGNACGADDALAKDTEYLPTLLESDADTDYRFAVAYVWRRFHTKSWEWIDDINRSQWSVRAKAEFFAQLPSIQKVWLRAESELAADKVEYWKRVRVLPSRDNLEGFDHAIAQLLVNGRADVAIQCFWLGDLWTGIYPELALQALEQFDPEKNRIDAHAIQEILKRLQEFESIDEKRLAAMEWNFLPLLDEHNGGTCPRTLYRNLAEQPEFFCEVIRMIYRSQKEVAKGDEKEQVDETKAAMAHNACKLLMDWSYPPGLKRDGCFRSEHLKAWVVSVKEACVASGHWEVASHQVGEVLYYAPKDENDLWIDSVCDLLDSKEDEEYRRGLSIRIFNSRGVHGFSGGKEEIELAEKWERIAAHAEAKGYGRLGLSLRELGKSYREDAKRMVAEYRHEFD